MSGTKFAARFEGGPLDGTVFMEGPWPPPEEWPEQGGRYQRTSMSNLTDEQADHPNLMRGVVYKWVKLAREHGL